MISRSFFGFIIILFPSISSATTLADDSSFVNKAFQEAAQASRKDWGSFEPWANGRVYFPYQYRFEKGTPFFPSTEFQDGTLVYEGVTYQNRPLLLDLLSNRLITKNGSLSLELINERVNSLSIGSDNFRYVFNAGIPNGYYQVIYGGKTPVLRRIRKTVEEVPTVGVGVVRNIHDEELFYVQQGDSFTPIKNTKTLLSTLGNHEEELKKYIKSEKLKWKRGRERLLTQVVSYYDQLNSK